MSLYRVVISFMRENMQFMSERGVLAMSPGNALDDAVSALGVDQTKVHSFKSLVWRPEALTDFSDDAQFLACIGSKHSVRDVWNKRYEK